MNTSLIHLLKSEVRKYVFGLFFALLGCSFLFHMGWSWMAKNDKEKEIKQSIVKSLQEPLRKKALLDIKNILIGHGLTNPAISICLKLKDGTSLTDGNCDNAQYEKAEISMIDDYFFISVDERLNWEVLYSYLILLFIGFCLFYWTRRKLNTVSKTIVSDLDNVVDTRNSHNFNYNELKNLHEEVKKGRKALQEAEEMRRREDLWQLTARFVHDIRGPLSVIKEVGTHIENSSTKEDKALFGHAVESAEGIISGLLSKYRNSLEEDKNTPTKIVNTLNSCIAMAKISNPSVNISMSQKIPLDLSINMPRLALERVINNIIKNSCDAISSKSGRLEVKCSQKDQMIVVTISDDGKGIPQEVLKKAFKEKISFGKENGNGLGLFISKELIEASHGKIAIESQENVGTKVTLCFPLAQTSAPVQKLGSSKMVLIDDSDLIRLCWETEAKKRGHPLTIYKDYNDLFDNIDSHDKNDFFFCDGIINGQINGIEASRKLHDQGFKNIYLQTADRETVLQKQLSWLMGVLDKNYPYLQNLQNFS